MPERPLKVIENAREAVAAVGGANVVAELLGIGPNAVRNWYERKGIPPEAYSKLAPRLLAAGCSFSDDLFQQYPRPKVSREKKPRKNGRRR